MKIGIFGGCFNPPHKMHKDIAIELIERNYIDKVIFVPTGNLYKKRDLIPHKDRYNMIEAFTNKIENISVSKIGNEKKYQYTYQVLDYFKNIEKAAEIYFICGIDNLDEFEMWKNHEYILSNYKLLVIKRNDYDDYKLLKKYEKYRENIIITDIEPQYISSTNLRYLIREGKYKKTLDFIDEEVYNYIVNHNLYI